MRNRNMQVCNSKMHSKACTL